MARALKERQGGAARCTGNQGCCRGAVTGPQRASSSPSAQITNRHRGRVTGSDNSPFAAPSAKSRSPAQLQFHLLTDGGRTCCAVSLEFTQWEIRDPREKELESAEYIVTEAGIQSSGK